MDFYYNSICHICKNFTPDLKRCASCKHISYCSKEHQQQDWIKHKALCKIIKKTRAILKLKIGCTYEEYRNYRVGLYNIWSSKLGRELKLYESQMWMYPRVCAVCYSTENLKDCLNCLSVAYCCNEHKDLDESVHHPNCEELKLCLNLDRELSGYTFQNPILEKINNDIEKLPENMKKFMCLIFDKDMKTFPQEVALWDNFSHITTILFALEQSNLLKLRTFHKNDLVIHIVGANLMQEGLINWEVVVQFFFLWIKNLNFLKIILIGPEIGESPFTKHNIANHVEFECYKELYHNKVKKIDVPDIVVAFNSGLNEFKGNSTSDTWKESIPSLVHYNQTPLLLTAYTKEEMRKDLARFQSQEIKSIVDLQKNPFINFRPLRDWDSHNSFFYVHGFVSVICKNK